VAVWVFEFKSLIEQQLSFFLFLLFRHFSPAFVQNLLKKKGRGKAIVIPVLSE